MAWYERSGPGQDVFVSTRVRLARNLEGYPFEQRLTEPMAKELIEKVTALFPSSEGYTVTDMDALSANASQALAERHYVSGEFAQKRAPRALIREEMKGLSVMVCEEDHLRIQAMAAGFAPDECLAAALEAERRIDRALPLAYDEALGYLTHCPTNLGTGLRVSVMMFLPALSTTGRMPGLSAQLGKLGLVIRGTRGEGTEAEGYLYQISNRLSLGLSEEETLAKVRDVVRRVAENERKLRRAAAGEMLLRLSDRAFRALGILREARMLSTREFFSLWADLRLGAALGEVRDLPLEKLDRMIFEVMPAEMAEASRDMPADFSPETRRDLARAGTVREMLCS